MSSAPMKTSVPECDEGTEGVKGTREVPQIAALVSIRHALSEGKSAAELHKATGPAISKVLEAFEQDKAAAAVISKTPQKMSDYKAGRRPLNAGEFIGILDESRESWRAFKAMMEARHQPRMTLDQFVQMLIDMVAANPVFLRYAVEEAELRFGATEDEVVRFVRGGQ